MQSMEGKQTLFGPVWPAQQGLPRAAKRPMPLLLPHLTQGQYHVPFTHVPAYSEAGTVPIKEVSLLDTQFSEDTHMNICSFREYSQDYVEALEQGMGLTGLIICLGQGGRPSKSK